MKKCLFLCGPETHWCGHTFPQGPSTQTVLQTLRSPRAGKNFAEGQGRCAYCPFRRGAVLHTQEKSDGTCSLHFRRGKRTTDQICMMLTSLGTFPISLLHSISQLRLELNTEQYTKALGCLYEGQWEGRKASETLFQSKENLKQKTPRERGSGHHWKSGSRRTEEEERQTQKQCRHKIVQSQVLNT